MFPLPRLLACAGLLLGNACATHAAIVYDATAGFSTTANSDTSLWSYRTSVSAAHDGNYPLLPNFGPFAGFTGPPAGTAGWAVAGVPAIGLNTTGADQYFTGFGPGAQFTWPSGTLFMHPGASTLAVMSWLSPTASMLQISFQFADMDANPAFRDGVAWSVEKNNGGSALASGQVALGGDSGALSLSNIAVAAGDRINFIVGGTGDFQGDSTRIMATITASPAAVPEPASLVLTLAGFAALLASRRVGRCGPSAPR